MADALALPMLPTQELRWRLDRETGTVLQQRWRGVEQVPQSPDCPFGTREVEEWRDVPVIDGE